MNDQESQDQESRAIGPSTRVSLGAITAVFVAVLGVGWALSARLATIDTRLQNLESRNDGREVAQVAARVAALESDLRTWADTLRSTLVSQGFRLDKLEELWKQGERFTASDMDLWIEQAKVRANLPLLPDRKKH